MRVLTSKLEISWYLKWLFGTLDVEHQEWLNQNLSTACEHVQIECSGKKGILILILLRDMSSFPFSKFHICLNSIHWDLLSMFLLSKRIIDHSIWSACTKMMQLKSSPPTSISSKVYLREALKQFSCSLCYKGSVDLLSHFTKVKCNSWS